MRESRSSLRLFTLWRRRVDEPAAAEPADLGTAFGLELSMLPDDDANPPQTPPPGPWWQRLTQRAVG